MKILANNRAKLAITCITVAALGVVANTTTAGNNSEQKSRAGFDCFTAGPSDWTHCWRVKDFSEPAIAVMVYSADGAEFLGTELLIREDLYTGQPCPQDGGNWELNPFIPYYACHRFHTGHH